MSAAAEVLQQQKQGYYDYGKFLMNICFTSLPEFDNTFTISVSPIFLFFKTLDTSANDLHHGTNNKISLKPDIVFHCSEILKKFLAEIFCTFVVSVLYHN